ncbi:twitching motility protein PilT [Desulforamulus putei DSM 12395]|uniref:Twitching motility protein PilT n=1 Tax=Desulforamulus putei DSM 12395 TaxID=1121429 RepID=A0A1M4UUZ7_9FIRM|nr:type IV pilus twitching motility protein PilT [Desulforamulus putei]SHE60420.1 twitching motility protein PilT [Desulforamulus putei DSM 12395]
MQINELLQLAFQYGASDVHITVNSAPCFRINGHLRPLNAPEIQKQFGLMSSKVDILTAAATEQMVKDITTAEQYETFCATGDLDFSYATSDGYRYRVNAYRQQGCAAMAIRLINSRIYSFKELGLPDVLSYLARRPRGLVLVTGPTGSGKSTTLASMIDLINSEFAYHIITLEDPIEFVHQHKKSLINQREIGRDSKSFASALRSAMREDPDVILVGEMRDPETIAIAITAAETGHLVFGTLHTSSAAQTIDRIIDVFPPHQQQQIRVQLANTIQGVVAQQLLPRIDRPGRIAAIEVMVATPAIRNLIREGKTYQIISQIQTGAKFGMQSLDMSLKALYQMKAVSRDEVINRAIDPEGLQRMLG